MRVSLVFGKARQIFCSIVSTCSNLIPSLVAASYKLSTYTYIFQSSYGSPEVDHTNPKITKAVVADHGKSVRLFVDKLQRGHVHELHMPGVRSNNGLPLLHNVGYYTLNYIPEGP